MKHLTLEEEYRKLLADFITVSIEDLTINELQLITKSFVLFKDKLSDIKILEDDMYRLKIELANIKAMYVEDNDQDRSDVCQCSIEEGGEIMKNGRWHCMDCNKPI